VGRSKYKAKIKLVNDGLGGILKFVGGTGGNRGWVWRVTWAAEQLLRRFGAADAAATKREKRNTTNSSSDVIERSTLLSDHS
jgi:hypothetical protein